MYRAIDIGQAFLDLADKSEDIRSKEITPLKLMKLVYIAHGWQLALNGDILIKDDIEAWEYGPAIRDLYDKIKKYGRDPITKKISKDLSVDDLPKDIRAIVEGTFRVYGNSSAWYLSNVCHKIGSPWDKCIEKEIKIIPPEMIRDYYIELKARKEAERAA